MPSDKTSSLEQLQGWFASECNDDWEHSYGIHIETLDNPGWLIRIDLWETQLAQRGPFEKRWSRSDNDWAHIKVTDAIFEASCSAGNLQRMIDEFLFFSRNMQLIHD